MGSKAVTEDDVEQTLLQWLARLAWATDHGSVIAPTGADVPGAERATYHRWGRR